MGAEAEDATDNQGGGDDADKAGQYVLQRGEDRRSKGRGVMQLVDQVVVCHRRSRGLCAASRGHIRACQLFLYGHGLGEASRRLCSVPGEKLSGWSEWFDYSNLFTSIKTIYFKIVHKK